METARTMVRRIVPIGLLALTISSCGGSTGRDSVRARSDHHASRVTVQVIRADGDGRYEISRSGTRFDVDSPASNTPVKTGSDRMAVSGVISEAFWEDDQPRRYDQQVCVTMDSVVAPSSPRAVQELVANDNSYHRSGIVVRADPGVKGSTPRAVVISQVLERGGLWNMSVSSVEPRTDGKRVVDQTTSLGNLDFGSVVGTLTPTSSDSVTGTMHPAPWNICARVVGTDLTVKLWPSTDAEPSWSSRSHVRSLELPVGWVYPSYAGAFESELRPGRSSSFHDLEVSSPY